MPMLTANANANATANPNAYRCTRLHRLGELQAHLKFLIANMHGVDTHVMDTHGVDLDVSGPKGRELLVFYIFIVFPLQRIDSQHP